MSRWSYFIGWISHKSVKNARLDDLARKIVPYHWYSVVERVGLHPSYSVSRDWFVELATVFSAWSESTLKWRCDNAGIIRMNVFEDFDDITPQSSIPESWEVQLLQSFTIAHGVRQCMDVWCKMYGKVGKHGNHRFSADRTHWSPKITLVQYRQDYQK